ncbi:DnaJ domain [Trypanosoma vivax]|uniref:Putative heat shock protein DNAJ n=1 Tax=Trypanosoma vivax (strain Y486) TaxID=1055687 RepID=G0U9X2_TRYVY|nr:putative heat shock protein DNAJ [Trypanosoma vivax]KAH8619027.1 DnaJ domain [Trypanosoma vivax]CCC52603.1 putative heat shock protein DNAJ [Trypanosoma vivax Y486]
MLRIVISQRLTAARLNSRFFSSSGSLPRCMLARCGRWGFNYCARVGAACNSATLCHTTASSRRWQSSAWATIDYYRILGVSPDASQDEIKGAYKKLALKYHPDRNSEVGAEEKFKSISEAYNIVGNKERRRQYDAQRVASQFYAKGGVDSGSGGGAYSTGGFAHRGPPPGYEQMSTEEANRLFRDLFGGMRVDQIFRDLDVQCGPIGCGAHPFTQEFASSKRAFRPFFHSESSRVYMDGHGNSMEERTFTDSSGRSYTVRTTRSEQPQASVNQRAEDFYQKRADSSSDGRFHMGRASFKVNERGATNDFGTAYFGVRTHRRHPLISFLIIVAWTVVLGTLLVSAAVFLFSHPLFAIALIFLLVGRRMGFF